MINSVLRISTAAIILNMALWNFALADAKREPIEPSAVKAASMTMATTVERLPNCDLVYEKHHELAGKLPEDYPALHFDKEQLIKTIIDISNNPMINIDELARIFGLKFVTCKRAEDIKEGRPPQFAVETISNAGFPLKKMHKKYDSSVALLSYLDESSQSLKPALLSLSFDFSGDNAKVKTKMDLANCIVESDFHEYLKDKWELDVLYGHLGYKRYKREIDGLKVQFTARPYSIPDLRRDARNPFAGIPICIQSVSILIQADK